jgi:hypothetical protein
MKTIRTYINVAEAGFASSLLESAGIRTLLLGEESFLMLPGLATGGIHLQVEDEDAERALRLLTEGLDAVADKPLGALSSETRARKESADQLRIPIGLFAAGAAALALLFFAVHQWNETRRTGGQAAERFDADYDHDGRPDHFFVYRNGSIVSAEADRDGDGRIDAWGTFDSEGRNLHDELDQNFDGRPDAWYSYRDGEVHGSQADADFDGRPDWFSTYVHGIPVRTDCRPGDSAIVIRRYLLVAGDLREELVDENRDGAFDYKILYDPFGAPSDRMPIEAAK